MEQIYTIPVNEAFEACEKTCTCPFCSLEKTLEDNELDLILGASMMEPDVRQKTNEAGFCKNHFHKMMTVGKKLPFALILESHLAEIDKNINEPGIMPNISGASSAKKLSSITGDCYVCSRIEYNFSRMIDTSIVLWESDSDFRRKFSAQSGFCLPHFARLVSSAKLRLKGKEFKDFYRSAYNIEKKYIDATEEKVSRFVESFDYRYANEPLEDAKNATEDAVTFLVGE